MEPWRVSDSWQDFDSLMAYWMEHSKMDLIGLGCQRECQLEFVTAPQMGFDLWMGKWMEP